MPPHKLCVIVVLFALAALPRPRTSSWAELAGTTSLKVRDGATSSCVLSAQLTSPPANPSVHNSVKHKTKQNLLLNASSQENLISTW